MLGFPVDSDSKESTCNEGDLGSIPRLGRFPGGGHGNPLQYSCLEYPREQRSMVGYCPRGRKKSDAPGLLSMALIHVMTWVKHKNIMFSGEPGQKRPHIISFHLYEIFRKGKFLEIKK